MSLAKTTLHLGRKALSAMIVSVLGCRYWQRVFPRPYKGTPAGGNNGYEETDWGTVAVFIILFVAGFLVNGVWLGTTYREMRDSGFSFRPEEAMRHRFWLIWVSAALYSILFVWVHAKRRVENPWVGRGIRYGVLMTLFTVMPSTINDYVVYNLPHTLVLHWMIAGLITLILMGLAILKKSSAAEA
jgi:hypothetical protein